MNYEIKRKRRKGRQKKTEGDILYFQERIDKQWDAINLQIQAGILPPLTFDLKSFTQEQFKRDYQK